MKGYLADYGVDLEVYAYWVWRYYPDWLIWWQDYGSQANQESGATAEGAATAVDSAQGESATAVLPQLCILQDCLRVLTTSVKVVQDEMSSAIPINVKFFGLVAVVTCQRIWPLKVLHLTCDVV